MTTRPPSVAGGGAGDPPPGLLAENAARAARFDARELSPEEKLDRWSSVLGAAFATMGRLDTPDLKEPTPYERCVPPFIEAMGWVGEPRGLIEALPHFDPVRSMDDFRLVLANLGAPTRVRLERADALRSDQLPCLMEIDGAPMVALSRSVDGQLTLFDGARNATMRMRPPEGVRRICFSADAKEEIAEEAERNWFGVAFRQVRGELGSLLSLTLLINLLALSTPLFSMAVYNNILATRSAETLGFVVAMVLGALVFEDYLRRLRSRTMATGAARLNATILREGFGRILSLPLSMSINAPVASQTARLRQFEGVYGVFSSGLAAALLDIPFSLIFLVAIALIAGPLAFVPLLFIVAIAVFGLAFTPASRYYASAAGVRRSEAQELARRTITDAETIRSLGAEEIWMRRVAAAAHRSAAARFNAGAFNLIMNGGAQFMTALAGAVTLIVGALLVIDGALEIGGLIAVMMLVWRIFGPIQTVVLSAHQLLGAKEAAQQINKLMTLPSERRETGAASVFRSFSGHVRVDNLAYKYPGAAEFALRGVSFEAQAGQTIAICGPSGAGKSTLLKLILGLHRPLGGAVFLDGLNAAQLDPTEVRATVGYAPQRWQFLYGSLAQNIRLAHPIASDEEIVQELTRLGMSLGDSETPDGLQTRLSGEGRDKLSPCSRQQVALARALVKSAPLYLLDTPGEFLDQDARASLLARIKDLQGGATIFVAAPSPEIIRICDRVLVLQGGVLAADLPPETFFERIAAAQAKRRR